MNEPWKRYALFRCEGYYPCGARDDFIGTFESPEAALKCLASVDLGQAAETAQLVDTQTGRWQETLWYAPLRQGGHLRWVDALGE